jgi:hypothetical protein
MAGVRLRKNRRCSFSFTFSCCFIWLNIYITVFIIFRPRPLVCLPESPENEIVDRRDEWRYQNSITGEWYHWRIGYKKQNENPTWRVRWLNSVPSSSLGVIVYLAIRNELESLNVSLTQLSRVLSINPRPVVIFHEGDFGDDDTQQSLARILGPRTPLAFERLHFSNQSNQPRSTHRGWSRSYFDMCRFFTLMLPNHPLLSLFSFYWRLDTHSYIFASKPIEDPFELMQKRQIQFAFIMTNEEADHYVTGLWSLFHEFLKRHCLKPSAAVRQTQTDWFGRHSLAIIFTNFAIVNVSLLRENSLLQAWLDTADRNGGIYRYRWGDAPIHTLALTQLLERNQIARLRYFGYMHRREYVCASGTKSDLCEKQIQPFMTDPKITYLNYQDGCYPSGNPLCHYYPEIKL